MLMPLDYLMEKYRFKPKGILHLGANTGQEAEMYNKMGIEFVYWVEAIPEVFRQLQINLLKYDNQDAFCACISDVNGKEVVFNVSNNDSQSSSFLKLGYHKEIHPTVDYVREFKTKTIRVDKLFKSFIFGQEWMLNADLQGGEIFALRGMGDKLNEFDYLYLELNKRETYIGCGLINEIDEYVYGYGFKRVEVAKWVGDCWTDGFYTRDHGNKR